MNLLRKYFGKPLKEHTAKDRRTSSPSPSQPSFFWGRDTTIPRFCENCISQTLSESPGDTGSMKMIGPLALLGTKLLGRRKRCPVCGSAVARLWISYIIPLFPLSRFRVLYLKDGIFCPTRYVGRKIPTATDFLKRSQAGRRQLNRRYTLIAVVATVLVLALLLLLTLHATL